MEELIVEYKESRCDFIFSKIYELVEKDIKNKLTYFRSKGFEEHDIQEGCDDALMECLDEWDSKKSSFSTFFKRRADSRIIDIRRKKMTRYKREVYEPEEEQQGTTFFESDISIEEFPSVEKSVIEDIKKIEQRQLFEEIVEKADEQLRQQLLVIAGGRSANYAAQKFKMHHQTLNRKLSRLSRNYSERWQEVCLNA